MDNIEAIVIEDDPEEIEQLLERNLSKGKGLDEVDHLSREALRLIDYDNEYDFFHERRGRALIINNTKFETGPQRRGGRHDTAKLFKILTDLDFDIQVCPDLTASQMLDKVREASSLMYYDHTIADCFMCIILSHGSHKTDEHGVAHDVVFGVDEELVYTRDIVDLVRDDACPHLVDKPRMFIFQACRGDDLDQGQEVTELRPVRGHDFRRDTVRGYDDATTPFGSKQNAPNDDHEDLVVSPTPLFKDVLVVYATAPGYSAWRGQDGSYFIQYLSEVFYSCHKEHVSFVKTLTRTANKMAVLFKSRTADSSSGKKQMPCIMTMLTKDICFRRKAVYV